MRSCAMMEFSGPAARHRTVAVNVGKVTVGGGAPVVVQSMTNTDTADAAATAQQVAALARAGSEIVRITVDRDEAAAAVPHIKERLRQNERRRADRRRFSLYRPQAPCRPSRLRRGARQVSHQSRQCRLQGKERPAIRRHRRNRDPSRQAGAHRRQLGLARPGTADASDGPERAVEPAGRRARRDARGHGAIGAAVGGSAPKKSACRARKSSSPPKYRRCRI